MIDDEWIIDLQVDPDEVQEMRNPSQELIEDRHIGKNRIVIRQISVVASPFTHDTPTGFIGLELIFHPSVQNRFKMADIRMMIEEPKDEVFYDIEPVAVVDSSEVSVIIVKGNKISATPITLLSAEETEKKQLTYKPRHYSVRGIGGGTSSVSWRILEAPKQKTGIDQQVNLFFTLRAGKQISAHISVDAELAHFSLDGAVEKARRLIGINRLLPVTFSIPTDENTIDRDGVIFKL